MGAKELLSKIDLSGDGLVDRDEFMDYFCYRLPEAEDEFKEACQHYMEAAQDLQPQVFAQASVEPLQDAPVEPVEENPTTLRDRYRGSMGPLRDALSAVMTSEAARMLAVRRGKTGPWRDEIKLLTPGGGAAFSFGWTLAEVWTELLQERADTEASQDVKSPFEGFDEEESAKISDLLEYFEQAVRMEPEMTSQGILSLWGYFTFTRSGGVLRGCRSCGQHFKSDEAFCRHCGTARPPGAVGVEQASPHVTFVEKDDSGGDRSVTQLLEEDKPETEPERGKFGVRSRTQQVRAATTPEPEARTEELRMAKLQSEALEITSLHRSLLQRRARIAELEAQLRASQQHAQDTAVSTQRSSSENVTHVLQVQTRGGSNMESQKPRSSKVEDRVEDQERSLVQKKEKPEDQERRLTRELEDLDRKLLQPGSRRGSAASAASGGSARLAKGTFVAAAAEPQADTANETPGGTT